MIGAVVFEQITVPAEVQTAFWGLALLAISVAAKYLHSYLKKLDEALAVNTELTKKVEGQTNGRLEAAERKLAEALDQLQARTLERDVLADIVRFVQAQPESQDMLDRYKERRVARVANDPIRDLLNEVRR